MHSYLQLLVTIRNMFLKTTDESLIFRQYLYHQIEIRKKCEQEKKYRKKCKLKWLHCEEDTEF